MTHELLARYQKPLQRSHVALVSAVLGGVLCKALNRHLDALVGGFVFAYPQKIAFLINLCRVCNGIIAGCIRKI